MFQLSGIHLVKAKSGLELVVSRDVVCMIMECGREWHADVQTELGFGLPARQ